MKIGIDARFFGPKCKGLGRYVQKLLDYLEEIDHKNEYFVFLTKEGFANYQPQRSNFKKVLANYRWYTFKEQIFFPGLLNRYKLDLVHFCHFNVPIFYFRPFIITIHDLILFHYPTIKNTTLNRFFYFFKLGAYHLVIRSAMLRAEKIIAVSEFTRKDIISKMGVKENKTIVIYEGYEIQKNSPENDKRGNDFSSKYDIMKPYIIYVGNAYPHKNLEKLCLAFDLLQKKFDGLKLLLVGESDYFYDCLEKFVKEKQIKNIIFTGFVDDIELDYLYKNAECFVFPSLYEGFGLPPLEALSRGTAVACSMAGSIPEITGGKVEYFNPEEENSIADSVGRVLSDKKYAKKIVWRSNFLLEKFSWRKMAKEIKDEYLKIGDEKV
jgi:glycosyltransferase involved in cell wall biosynthesis